SRASRRKRANLSARLRCRAAIRVRMPWKTATGSKRSWTRSPPKSWRSGGGGVNWNGKRPKTKAGKEQSERKIGRTSNEAKVYLPCDDAINGEHWRARAIHLRRHLHSLRTARARDASISNLL